MSNTYWVSFRILLIGVPTKEMAIDMVKETLLDDFKRNNYDMFVVEEVVDYDDGEIKPCKPSSLS